MGKKIWTKEERERFKDVVSEGYGISKIEELTGLSKYTIRTEIKRGTTEEEYKNQQYVKYSVRRAILTEARELMGSSIDLVLENDYEE
ncbi:MAG: hypothetical protein SOR72_04285 [Hornefia sp.]|nr:hypothetical protein [Hornefia sp.]